VNREHSIDSAVVAEINAAELVALKICLENLGLQNFLLHFQ